MQSPRPPTHPELTLPTCVASQTSRGFWDPQNSQSHFPDPSGATSAEDLDAGSSVRGEAELIQVLDPAEPNRK